MDFLKKIWDKISFIFIAILALLGTIFLASKYKRSSKNIQDIPLKRTDNEGNLIPKGESDDRGYIQPTEGDLEDPGIFSDNESIVIKEKPIDLPKGIENKDIKEISQIGISSNEIRNSDTPSVDTEKLLKELSKL